MEWHIHGSWRPSLLKINLHAYLPVVKWDGQGTWQHELQIMHSWKNSEQDFSDDNTVMVSGNSSWSCQRASHSIPHMLTLLHQPVFIQAEQKGSHIWEWALLASLTTGQPTPVTSQVSLDTEQLKMAILNQKDHGKLEILKTVSALAHQHGTLHGDCAPRSKLALPR